MCGIVGLISSANNGQTREEVACFRDMLLLSAVRGLDSTGSFTVSFDGDITYLKSAVTSGEFVKDKAYIDFSNTMYSSGMFSVGHTRAATRGDITDSNAHPFCVNDELILVQNGTLYEDHKKIAAVDVDSHAVAILLHRESDIEKALNSINAAFCLVWYDIRNTTLNIIRNEERPLWLAHSKDGAILFASEAALIEASASRNCIELTVKPYLLAENNLFSLTLNPTTKQYTSTNKVLKLQSVIPYGYTYSIKSTSGTGVKNMQPEDYIIEADPSLGISLDLATKIVEQSKSNYNQEVKYLELYDCYSRKSSAGTTTHYPLDYVVMWHDVLLNPADTPKLFYYTIITEKEVLASYKTLDAFKDAMEMIETTMLQAAWKSAPYAFNSENKYVVLSYISYKNIKPILKQ